jgi:hypothetical protein
VRSENAAEENRKNKDMIAMKYGRIKKIGKRTEGVLIMVKMI